MPRTRLIALACAVMLGLTASPASANVAESDWELSPSSPITAPAGVRCAFAVHIEQSVDGVRTRVLATYPDGSVKQREFVGPLVDTVTNMATGASLDVNASGHATIDYNPDGSQTWNWAGPVLMGFAAGHSNHAPGLYLLTGHYTVDISASSRTVRAASGTELDLCAALS